MAQSESQSDNIVQDIRRKNNVVTIVLSGEIDMYRSVNFRNSLLGILDEKPSTVLIDMNQVGFMDSSGLATLVEALQLTRRYDGEFKLVGIQKRVRSIFEISRLDTIFQIYASEAEALAE